jgi:hypothetical protein
MRIARFRPSLAALTVLIVLASSCRDKPAATPVATHSRPAVLAEIPVYPGSTKSDTTGTDEVERGTWVVQQRLRYVGPFYRDTLPKLGWHVMSDEGDTAKLDLYAQRDTLNLWVHVEALGMLAARYTVIAGTKSVGPNTGAVGTPSRPRS